MKMILFLFLLDIQYELTGETDRKGDRDPKKRATDIIAKLDVTGDKKLSKAEFIAGYIEDDFSFSFTMRVSFHFSFDQSSCKSDPVIKQLLAPNA